MKALSAVNIISNHKLLCRDAYGDLYYHAGALYWMPNRAETLERICSVSDQIYAKMRPAERLLRMEPRFAFPVEAYTYYVSWGGALHLIDVKTKKVQEVFTYRAGMNNPLHITNIKGIDGFEDGFVFGDYWGNPKHECVNVYGLNQNGCRIKYQFAPSTIQHIHNVCVDETSNRILICTGDSDDESGIWEVFDDFRCVKPLIRGSQKYRTCSAYITDRGILYATDTPLCENGIYLFDEKHRKLTMVYKMPGPCIYSTKIKTVSGTEKFVFATSVEPDSSLPGWRYHLTYKLGAGVVSRSTHIIIGNAEEGFREVASLRKDAWPMWLFQFGNVQFPSFPGGNDQIICTGQALKKYDGKTIHIEI